MTVHSIAQKYVDGAYEDLNGVGLHDAVHILATRNGYNKAEVRAAIQQAYADMLTEATELFDTTDGYVNVDVVEEADSGDESVL